MASVAENMVQTLVRVGMRRVPVLPGDSPTIPPTIALEQAKGLALELARTDWRQLF